MKQYLLCRYRISLLAGCLALLAGLSTAMADTISGELKQWHKVVLDWTGPSRTENSATYLDHRLDVTFTHSGTGTRRVVPGFFAADGNAGESSATAGTIWRVHFMPDQPGVWNYSVSFRTGSNVAIAADPMAGSGGGLMNGETGSFTVSASDKSGKDFRAPTMGKLIYTGKSYPQWMGSGDGIITAACNSPEVFLEFNDFDGTPTTDRPYTIHVADWQVGDPTWKGTKGKGIIGVVNYLSSIGINSHYFLTMNIEGDGKQAFPYINNQQASRTVFDVSKLAQWGVVFEHMMSKGIQVQFVLTECENQSWFEFLDGSSFGNSRKLYYREMVARFGHLNAVTWNIGEENGWDRTTDFSVANTTAQRIAFADHLQTLLSHPDNITIHNGPSSNQDIFANIDGGIVGKSAYRGISFQGNFGDATHGHGRILKWRTDSTAAGQPWIVSYDEPFSSTGTPDIDTWRKNSCWAAFTAGAAGVGYYAGGGKDLSVQDYRLEATYWNTVVRAKDFFASHVDHVTSMNPADSLVSTGAWCLANPGVNYVIYVPSGGSPTLNLTSQTGSFTVKWYDPRNGGSLLDGTVTSVAGGAIRSLGSAPNSTTNDWAVLVEGSPVNTAPNISTTSLENGERNSAYHQTIIASQGNAPFAWSIVSGSLPSGFSLAATTGTIGGTTSVAGTYHFTVQVSDADGDIDQQALSITINLLKAQTITFPVISDQFTTIPTVSLTATASSGLPVSYSVISGPATVSGSTLTLTGTGSVTVRASQAGNTTYAAATAVNRSFNVTTPPPEKFYNESGGVVVMEVESQPLPAEGWAQASAINGSTASIFGSYYVGTLDRFSAPGTGILEYKIVITTPGEYQLQWRSFITDKNFGISQETTEHNDSFARMLSSSGASMPAFGPVPGWTGGTGDANPDKTGDNWYKIYLNAKLNWSWDAKNQDNAPLPVYWTLAAGTYTFQISVRSAGHAIDRILLWNRAGTTAYGNKTSGGGNTTACNNAPLSTITGGTTGQTQTIMFPVISDQDMTSPTVNFTATATSGLAVTYSVVSGPATVSGTTLTLTGAGSVTVRAFQAGNTTYAPATPVDRTFRVTTGPAVTVTPLHDAYLENGTRFNTIDLRVESAPTRKRIAYLQFTVPALPSLPSAASLVLTEGTDISSGSMTIRAYAGATNSWTESNLSPLNAPVKGALLDTFVGNVTDGMAVTFNFGSFVTGAGTYSFVIEADDSPLDVSFVSKEGGPVPRLELTLVNLASDYETWSNSNQVSGSPIDDDNHDGISNFEAYAFGLGSTGGESITRISPEFARTTGTLSYTRRKQSLTNLTYTVCSSSTLATDDWIDLIKNIDYTEAVSTSSDVEMVTITLTVAPAASKMFLQVRAD